MGTPRIASDAELLDVLDRGEFVSEPERAAMLARAADRDVDVGALPIGARDRLILRLRAQLLGLAIEAHDACPHCGEEASLQLDCIELVQAGAATSTTSVHLSDGEYDVTARPPASADLAAAAVAADPATARDALLAATILRATKAGEAVAATALPAPVVAEIGRRIAEADPLADITLAVTCNACGGSWDTALEPGDFVWRELRDWGRRLLWEVHVLATAYGWPEHEILSVPASRRNAYLELVLGG